MENNTQNTQSAQPNVLVSRLLAKQQNVPPSPLDDSTLSYNNALKFLGDQSYDNLCEKFVEQQTYGKSDLFPSAVDAWNYYNNEGKTSSGNVLLAPKGALIYFSPDTSNFGDGHVAISSGDGNMVAATSGGVQTTSISKWIKATGQQPLGYVMP